MAHLSTEQGEMGHVQRSIYDSGPPSKMEGALKFGMIAWVHYEEIRGGLMYSSRLFQNTPLESLSAKVTRLGPREGANLEKYHPCGVGWEWVSSAQHTIRYQSNEYCKNGGESVRESLGL